MKIIQDYIPAGRRNRPMTNPASSLYKKTMQAKYITIHEAWSTANAKALHSYVKSQRAADRPASWHFSIDEKDCYQALPLTESGWHAGDNLGPGNTTTIGIEICDYGMRRDNNWNLFWQAVDHAARLCVHLIKEIPSLHPYPQCLKQHNDWSGKNCPALIRNGGHWQKFVDLVGAYLREPESPPAIPITDLPKIQREIGIEVDGNFVNETGYLIGNKTYVRASWLLGLAGNLRVTGHGDHIKITRRGM